MTTRLIGLACLAFVLIAPVVAADPPVTGDGLPPEELGWGRCTIFSYTLNPPGYMLRPECITGT